MERQVARGRFADERFAGQLQEFTVVDPAVDLALPAESARGRYWYNLHLVLCSGEHKPLGDIALLRALREGFFKVAAKKNHAVARLAVMPDHLHAELRPHTHETPLEVVYAYQNNLAYLAGQRKIWSDGFYVGTFGEYAMQAVRKQLKEGREGP